MTKISEQDYCDFDEAAKIMGMSPEQFRERLNWGRGPVAVGRDRDGRAIWVRKMVEKVREARVAGHVL